MDVLHLRYGFVTLDIKSLSQIIYYGGITKCLCSYDIMMVMMVVMVVAAVGGQKTPSTPIRVSEQLSHIIMKRIY